jgi:hypothetical protein
VLNRAWKPISLQIIIFVYVCSTGGIVELNTLFETWITRNDVNGVSFFHLSYLITHMAYLWSQRTPNVQIKNFMFHWSTWSLFVLNTNLKRDSLQMMIFVNICFTWNMVHIKDAFWYVSNKKWSKWCTFVSPFLFNNA